MNSRFKKAFATFLILVMLLVVMPVTRLDITASAETLGGACGQNLKWTLNVETGEFLIEGEGEMYSYEMEHRLPWYDYSSLIKFVIVKADIPGIENNWLGGGFSFCENLIAFSVDETNTGYSTDENGVLFNKNKTILFQYPCGNPRDEYIIPDTVKCISWLAFGHNKNLVNITIPEGVTEIVTDAFFECNNLTSIIIPDSTTTVGSYAFSYCDKLENVTVSKKLTVIEYGTFYNCGNLSDITIPNSVDFVGESAFAGCEGLTDVYYTGTEEEWKDITIESGNDALLNAKIHFEASESNAVGDVDGDGKINSSDALACLQYSVGKTGLTENAFKVADVDKNGKVNSSDALKILQFVVGKIEKL